MQEWQPHQLALRLAPTDALSISLVLISDSCHSIHSLALHTYSHASEEHVRLIMRVEHRSDGSDRLAHWKEYALARYISARPAPLPITYSCMGRGKEQFSLRACFAAHAVSTRPSFYPIARVGLLDQVRGWSTYVDRDTMYSIAISVMGHIWSPRLLLLLQVIIMVRLYYSRAASILSRAESISLSAPARVYYNLQPEARCFNPRRI